MPKRFVFGSRVEAAAVAGERRPSGAAGRRQCGSGGGGPHRARDTAGRGEPAVGLPVQRPLGCSGGLAYGAAHPPPNTKMPCCRSLLERGASAAACARCVRALRMTGQSSDRPGRSSVRSVLDPLLASVQVHDNFKDPSLWEGLTTRSGIAGDLVVAAFQKEIRWRPTPPARRRRSRRRR